MIKILALSGSTRKRSVNSDILKILKGKCGNGIDFEIHDGLDQLPHFNQDMTDENIPQEVVGFRNKIEQSDGVLISTPEYVFSIPGVVKNAIEWLVSTIVLSEKPVAIITASSAGEKAHESLMLVIKTLYCQMTDDTSLLISGAKSKINAEGIITDKGTENQLDHLLHSFIELIKNNDN